MPEKDDNIDRRVAEPEFGVAAELHKSIVVAKEAKALRLNRGQMFKNGHLQDQYELEVTTKRVESPLAPEIDLPALKQSFVTQLGRNSMLNDHRLNLITHS